MRKGREGWSSPPSLPRIQIKAHNWLIDRFNLLTIVEAPAAETISRLALAIGLQGNGRTETFRAFALDEFKSVI